MPKLIVAGSLMQNKKTKDLVIKGYTLFTWLELKLIYETFSLTSAINEV